MADDDTPDPGSGEAGDSPNEPLGSDTAQPGVGHGGPDAVAGHADDGAGQAGAGGEVGVGRDEADARGNADAGQVGARGANAGAEAVAPPELVSVLAAPEFSLAPAGAHTDIDHLKPSDVKEANWNPDKHAALVQAQLAFRLIWVLVGVLVGGGSLISTTKWTGLATKDVTDFFGVAFGAVVTLATAATSFWFGSQRTHATTGRGNHDHV